MSSPPPVYDLTHGGHPRDCAQFGVIGYDVIRSTWGEDRSMTLTVTDYVAGPSNYLHALTLAKAHRTGPGAYGYPTPRYACGCRWIATALQPSGRNPAPQFTDLNPEDVERAASMARHPAGRDLTRDAVDVLAAAGMLAD